MRIFTAILLFHSLGLCKFELPRNLDGEGQRKLIQTLGYSLGVKMPPSPEPLGGYDGFQVSLQHNIVDVTELKAVGTGGSEARHLSNQSVSFGKGLFYDVDSFFSVSPPQGEDYRSAGVLLRGRVYEFNKISLGLLTHGSLGKLNSQFGSSILGFDLYVFMPWQGIYFYGGLGKAYGTFTFLGGGQNLSPPQDSDTTRTTAVDHRWAGLSKNFGRWFFAGLWESYGEPIYSLNLGYNF